MRRQNAIDGPNRAGHPLTIAVSAVSQRSVDANQSEIEVYSNGIARKASEIIDKSPWSLTPLLR